ncbi:hypothetical protein PE067_09690 [Paracoccus sp. DMF-8]|uniref:hypothetical protein n=1 Tax=Paracoccus sp. DMF-8 TaxID=3019445 RepID=UPI0023E80108|nr:hypothetical protein [Paracoccus sp. DMF-8]MDF3606388.1 hypothetical protein [Paracoccus sp. DMF-8]
MTRIAHRAVEIAGSLLLALQLTRRPIMQKRAKAILAEDARVPVIPDTANSRRLAPKCHEDFDIPGAIRPEAGGRRIAGPQRDPSLVALFDDEQLGMEARAILGRRHGFGVGLVRRNSSQSTSPTSGAFTCCRLPCSSPSSRNATPQDRSRVRLRDMMIRRWRMTNFEFPEYLLVTRHKPHDTADLSLLRVEAQLDGRMGKVPPRFIDQAALICLMAHCSGCPQQGCRSTNIYSRCSRSRSISPLAR